MKYVIAAFLIILPALTFSQGADSIYRLDMKQAATWADADGLFKQVDASLPADPARTARLAAVTASYKADAPLTKGGGARIAAALLNIDSSVMYKIFSNERYAFRACAAEGIFSMESAPSQVMSGAELLELAAAVSSGLGVE